MIRERVSQVSGAKLTWAFNNILTFKSKTFSTNYDTRLLKHFECSKNCKLCVFSSIIREVMETSMSLQASHSQTKHEIYLSTF